MISSPCNVSKQPRYELSKKQKSLIKSDTANSKLWDSLLSPSQAQVRHFYCMAPVD